MPVNFVQQPCDACRGRGFIRPKDGVQGPCIACTGTGRRFVPQGYGQHDIEEVRDLIDAMAIRASA